MPNGSKFSCFLLPSLSYFSMKDDRDAYIFLLVLKGPNAKLMKLDILDKGVLEEYMYIHLPSILLFKLWCMCK